MVTGASWVHFKPRKTKIGQKKRLTAFLFESVEMPFIDESDFVNTRKGFIVKDNPDWEIDSSILLDLADSLDYISDFEEELKSADSDSVRGQLHGEFQPSLLSY